MSSLIFDLDGTLIDTSAVFVPAIRNTLQVFSSRDQPTEDEIRKTFGLTDAEFWDVLLPGSSDGERAAASAMRNDYMQAHLDQAHMLLPHAKDVLRQLKANGHTLTIASNCGVTYLKSVLESQGIQDFFTNPLCIESVNGRVKADILSAHFERMSKQGAYMIGGRASDVEAAHAHGIPAIGCCLGFGNDEELTHADYTIHSLLELIDMFGAA